MRWSSRRRIIEIELHLRRRLCRSGCGEIGLDGEPHRAGIEHCRKRSERGVVLLYGIVKSAALDRDAIFRAFQLRLQFGEIGRAMQLGIIFRHGQDADDGGTQALLCLLKLGELSRIRGGGIGVDAGILRGSAGLGHVLKRRFLKVCGALNGLHEIGDEIDSPLVNVLHLGPLTIDALREAREAVVSAYDG